MSKKEQFQHNLKRIKSEKSFKREQQIFPKNVKLKTGLTIQRMNKKKQFLLKYFINNPNMENPKEFIENLDKKMLNIMYERVKQDLNENK